MEEDRRKKIFLLRVIIASITVLILTLWLLNLQNVWRYTAENAPAEDTSWVQLRTDLNKTLGDIKSQLDEAKANREKQTKEASEAVLNSLLVETEKSAASSATSTEIATSTITATSTIVATSTAPSAGTLPPLKNNNCPEYIDCMPTIGKARSCVIPVGCEGITQIAY